MGIAVACMLHLMSHTQQACLATVRWRCDKTNRGKSQKCNTQVIPSQIIGVKHL